MEYLLYNHGIIPTLQLDQSKGSGNKNPITSVRSCEYPHFLWLHLQLFTWNPPLSVGKLAQKLGPIQTSNFESHQDFCFVFWGICSGTQAQAPFFSSSGYMVMFSDFSLKALIASWKSVARRFKSRENCWIWGGDLAMRPWGNDASEGGTIPKTPYHGKFQKLRGEKRPR